MTLDRLGRWRLPAVALGALALALAVVVVILLPSTLLAPDASPTPVDTVPASATTAPGDTPEAAVRAFFKAFAEARETGDASVIEPLVPGIDSSAYLTVEAFLRGQTEQGKASIVTMSELSNFEIEQDGDRAVVLFDHRVGGYDIDLNSGEPLETPVALPAQRKRVELVRIDRTWLVDSFENVE